ncbi:ubiquitin-conjugating enzyme/RWD-like protein [Coniochaeta sp. 2T2.1]|nr:ubiquitin-conjugating enzyme/RWD-like protein [Coniochaeta sp. 2T2.1]
MPTPTPKFNSKSPTIRRIMREAAELSNSPSPDYTATPLESDLFEWHFTLRGPPNSPYDGGIYHGRIVLPPTYPLRPPSFRFSTPSGRFEANREICLSISGHHEETWQPAWGVRTALVALRSFMETDAKGQLGGLDTSDAVRKRLAGESGSWKCGVCNGGKSNREIMEEQEEVVRLMEEAEGRKREEEVVVPEELRMGFKDEMGKGKERGEDKEKGDMDEESAQLAEGFVRTAPVEGETGATVPAVGAPAQNLPQPSRIVTLPLPSQVRQPQQVVGVPQVQLQERRINDGVPIWIDRLIVGLGFLLAAMVLKVFLGN